MSIFDKRVNYKPFEYTFPQTIIDAINKVYWVHSEVDFTSDVQDYRARLNDVEREAYTRSFLSIAQIEVAVKTFWGKLYDHFPKPEFNALGATLAENECYDSETEVLTSKGFKLFPELTYEDKVASYNIETKEILFEEPSHILIKDYNGIMHHYKSTMTDLKVTPKHNIIVINPHSRHTRLAPSEEGKWGRNFSYPMSGIGVGESKLFTDLDRLFIAIQADGSLYGTTPSGKETKRLDFCFDLSRIDKIKRVKYLLNRLEIKYKENVRKDGKTIINASFIGMLEYEDIIGIKTFDYINLEDVNKEWGEQFLEELSLWDSNLRGGLISYYNSREEAIDKVSAIATLSGYSTNKGINRTAEEAMKTLNPDGTKRKTSQDCYVLSMYKKSNTVYPYREEVEYEGKVYCCTVSTGAIITRRGGRVAMSGNCRHESAYSRGLEVLGLDSRFETLIEVPAMKARLDLSESVLGRKDIPIELKLLFFTLVIENSALFSQFAIGMSFQRFKGLMKNISNMIGWTVYEELLHSEVGIWFINEIKKERSVFEGLDIESTVKQYIKVEEDILDWIFEEGDLDFITKEQLLNYIKYRMDEALIRIGFDKVFDISPEAIKDMMWFEEEVYSNSLDDFFCKRPTDYTKHDKSITEDDLF